MTSVAPCVPVPFRVSRLDACVRPRRRRALTDEHDPVSDAVTKRDQRERAGTKHSI